MNFNESVKKLHSVDNDKEPLVNVIQSHISKHVKKSQLKTLKLLFKIIDLSPSCAFLVQALTRYSEIDSYVKFAIPEHQFSPEILKTSKLAGEILEQKILEKLYRKHPIIDLISWSKEIFKISSACPRQPTNKLTEKFFIDHSYSVFHTKLREKFNHVILFFPFLYKYSDDVAISDYEDTLLRFIEQHSILANLVIDINWKLKDTEQDKKNNACYSASKALRRMKFDSTTDTYNFINLETPKDFYDYLTSKAQKETINSKNYREIAHYIGIYTGKKKTKNKTPKGNKNPLSKNKQYENDAELRWGKFIGFDKLFLSEDDDETDIVFIETEDGENAKELWVLDRTPVTNIEAKIGTGLSKQKYIRLANQLMFDEMSKSEIKTLTTLLTKIANSNTSTINDNRAAVYMIITLLTGANLPTLPQIQLEVGDPYEKRSESIIINIVNDQLWLVMPVLACTYNDRNFLKREDFYEPVQNIFRLKVKGVVKQICLAALSPFIENIEISFIANDLKQTFADIKKILKQSKLDERITLKSIQNHALSQSLSKADNEIWKAYSLAAIDDHAAKTQKHYSTIKENKINILYDTLAEKNFSDITSQQKLAPNEKSYYGNKYLPKKSLVINLFSELKKLITEQVFLPQDMPIEKLCDYANIMTIYTELSIAFSSGIREITNPYVDLANINTKGFTWVDDKKRKHGNNARTVYITKQVILQLHYFEHFKNGLTNHLGDKKLFSMNRSTFPGLFLLEVTSETKPTKIKIHPYTRHRAYTKTLNAYPQLRNLEKLIENGNRHFLRSTLLSKETTPEYIDALMGHWRVGTEPWSEFGLFDPIQFQIEITKAIEELIKSLKFEPANLQFGEHDA